jgi:hypothetical protein
MILEKKIKTMEKTIVVAVAAASEQKMYYILAILKNDNPAFRKAGVSIGVRSDSRITPKLECQHTINFDSLARFLSVN